LSSGFRCLVSLQRKRKRQFLKSGTIYAFTTLSKMARSKATVAIIEGAVGSATEDVVKIGGTWALGKIQQSGESASERPPQPISPVPNPLLPSFPAPGQTHVPNVNDSDLIHRANKCIIANCKSWEQFIDDLEKRTPPEPPFVPPSPSLRCAPDFNAVDALRRATLLDDGTSHTPRNAKWAAECYSITALKRSPVAEFDLADMLLEGDDGVPRDAEAGMKWMEAAAVDGFPDAQVHVALGYEIGDGFTIDLAQAGYIGTYKLRSQDTHLRNIVFPLCCSTALGTLVLIM
jgi:hypothetical protein